MQGNILDSIDLISFIPALFAVLLSLYNLYKMSKAADIVPNEIVNYALISSSYEGGYKLCIPLFFHNNGSKKGLINKIRIGFKEQDKIKYLDITGRARLSELEDEARNTDWEKFTKHGYKILQPTYPISILGDESTDVVMIATSTYEDGELPIDKETECIVEVYFGKDKMNKVKFPFLLKGDDILDDRIKWFSPYSDQE